MSEELRKQLVLAAAISGRSLNGEIVERLEASLAKDEATPGLKDGARAARAVGHVEQGRLMTRRRRHGLAAIAIALVAGSALGAALTLSKAPVAAQQSAGETSTALAGHIASLRAAPQTTNFGDPTSWEEELDVARAYPAESVQYGWLAEGRSGWKGKIKGKFKGKKNQWTSIGPSRALYPISPFRTRDLYVAGEYEAASRMPDIAIAPTCTKNDCTIWVGAAGGGIWRTKQGLDDKPKWQYVSEEFDLNAIGSIYVDPNDRKGDTLYVGTGEANSAGSAAAGVGIYKSTDGGNRWTKLNSAAFAGRAVGSIAVEPGDPNTIYAATTRAVRGISSTTAGAVSLIPGAPQWGLYKSTDGGQSWTFIHNGSADESQCNVNLDNTGATPCSPRGVRRVALDPHNPEVVYAGSYARGMWRSINGGQDWTQIFAPIAPGPATGFTERPEFAVAKLAGGKTRIYMQIGETGVLDSTFWVNQDAAGTGTFVQRSSPSVANPGWAVQGLCSNPAAGIGQCWYDQIVHSPAGHPDVVYVGGVYVYDEQIANHRGVVLSTDGGNTWNDMTEDATDDVHPQQLHPDQHALVTHPDNPLVFWEASDGGLVRSTGEFTNRSGVCASRGLPAAELARCQQMLSRVPTKLTPLNEGLTTIQFFTLSVSPHDPKIIQGGTQDNGTFDTNGDPATWKNINISDGGHNGFDVAIPEFRFTMFFQPQVFVNYSNGSDADWLWTSDPFYLTPEPKPFYTSVVSDPKVSKTMYAGLGHVWRTKTNGQGSLTLAQFRERCNLWTGSFADICGDWVTLGIAGPTGYLTGSAYGADRAGGNVSVVERTAGDTATLWSGTSGGRVFVTKNATAEPATAVVFDRVDTDSTIDPGRFVTGIAVDPTNPNRAWISYSGYDQATPGAEGHVFRVDYNATTGTATWTRVDGGAGGLPNTPVTDVAYDEVLGDLYASSDFGVAKLAAGSSEWADAAEGLPLVMVPSLTMVSGERFMLAATHGFAAWRLNLDRK